jgi:GNAT superfamily N-acetyltransferase
VHEIATGFGLLDAWPERPDFLDREQTTGGLVVATVDTRMVAFAGTFRRGDLTHLGDLFVEPQHQSRGLGQRLLDRLLTDASSTITFASTDPRALALYLRWGMRACGVLLYLTGSRRPNYPHETIRAASVDRIAALDGMAGGGDRTEDLAWYGQLPGVTIHASNNGYAFTRIVGDTIIVGPAAGRTPADCANVVTSAIATHDTPRTVRIAVPGTHPLAPTLIESGMRIADCDTILASEPDHIAFDRYIPHPDLG